MAEEINIAEDYVVESINQLAEETAPIREEILTELKPKVKFNTKNFASTVVATAHKGEELKKEEKRELMKQASWEFSKVKDFIHFQGDEEKPDKVETLMKQIACCVKWMEHAGSGRLWEYWQNKYGLNITVARQMECNTFFDKSSEDEDVIEQIRQCFKSADEVTGEIEDKETEIKEEMFERLPEKLKYSPENKRGLKPAQFDSIVTIKALKNIEEKKATKKANDMADKAMDSIVVNQIIFNTIEPDTGNE